MPDRPQEEFRSGSGFTLPGTFRRQILLSTCNWPGSRAPGSLVVALKPGGSKKPLFWSSNCAQEVLGLTASFADDRPIYGLRSTFQILDPTEHNTQMLALHYVEEITRIQPHGPYYLGGYCRGCDLVSEIAQQLLARGQDVETLILVETEPAAHCRSWRSELLGKLLFCGERLRAIWSEVAAASPNRSAFLRTPTLAKSLVKGTRGLFSRARSAAGRGLGGALGEAGARRYKIRPYPGRLILIFAARSHAGMLSRFKVFRKELANWATGNLEMHHLPASHDELARAGPHAAKLAQLIETSLSEGAVRSAASVRI